MVVPAGLGARVGAVHLGDVGRADERRMQLLQPQDTITIRLQPAAWELLVLAPLMQSATVQWAAIGLANMLNGGGAVLSSTLKDAQDGEAARATCKLVGPGSFVAYCRPAPQQLLLHGNAHAFTYDEDEGLLTVALLPEEEQTLEVVW